MGNAKDLAFEGLPRSGGQAQVLVRAQRRHKHPPPRRAAGHRTVQRNGPRREHGE
jgi:hypothetical protein